MYSLGGRGSRAVVVFSNYFAPRENRDRGGAAGNFFHAQAVAVISVHARSTLVCGADGLVLRIVDQRIAAVMGHVAVGVILFVLLNAVSSTPPSQLPVAPGTGLPAIQRAEETAERPSRART